MGSSNYNGFKVDDNLTGKDNFHAWKMTLDLNLEDQDVMEYVLGKIQEPPSTATSAAKTKYKKGEIKEKLMIRDSIHKSLVSYIYELGTSKDMYDNLVHMFKANNAKQVLFFKNQSKNLKKGRDESVQSYFLKLTEIRNNLLAIGETIDDQEMVLTALVGSHLNGMCSTLPF